MPGGSRGDDTEVLGALSQPGHVLGRGPALPALDGQCGGVCAVTPVPGSDFSREPQDLEKERAQGEWHPRTGSGEVPISAATLLWPVRGRLTWAAPVWDLEVHGA